EAIVRCIPEDVIDGPVRATVEDVLLTFRHHGGWIAGCWVTAGPRKISPALELEAIVRCIPEDVIDGVVLAAVEDVLLTLRHHGCWIAGCWVTAGPRILDAVPNLEAIVRCIPEDVIDGPVRATVEDVLLTLRHHGGWIAGC